MSFSSFGYVPFWCWLVGKKFCLFVCFLVAIMACDCVMPVSVVADVIPVSVVADVIPVSVVADGGQCGC